MVYFLYKLIFFLFEIFFKFIIKIFFLIDCFYRKLMWYEWSILLCSWLKVILLVFIWGSYLNLRWRIKIEDFVVVEVVVDGKEVFEIGL